MKICLLFSKRLIWRCVFCLLLGLMVPRAVAADEFMDHYSRGLTLYRTEQYQESIAEFEAAYAKKQLPRTLFNIARAYLKLGKAQEALNYFRRYQELEPHPPESIQTVVTEGVAQAQKLLAVLNKPPDPPPPDPPEAVPPTVVPTVVPPPVEPPPAPLATVPKVLPPTRPRWRLALGGAGIGVGAGLVGLGISALTVDGQCISAPMALQPCQLDFDTRGIGVGLTVSGVVFLGAGVVLLALPPRRAPRTESVR